MDASIISSRRSELVLKACLVPLQPGDLSVTGVALLAACRFGQRPVTPVVTLMVPGGEVRSYNQNLWMHHLTDGAAYLPL
jgi:hypothetical protein